MLLLMEWGEEIDFSFCMRSKNCIFIFIIIIIIINIVFAVVVVMFQNHQAMANSCGCCWYSGASPRVPIVRVPATSEGRWVPGRWRVIVVS